MKRLTLLTACVAVAAAAFAEGHQVNTLSAKQIGMAHSGIAMKLGAESMFFNPAGLSFSDRTLDLSASFSAIMATASCTHDGSKYTTDNKASTPMTVNAAFRVFDNLQAGVSFFTPYGSSINWTDNWAGAVLNQNVSLKVYTLQPTVSWRLTSRLSVGAGLMVSWGSVDLNKGLVPAATLDQVMKMMVAAGQLPSQVPMFGQTVPASINLNGSAGVVAGINAGVMFDVSETLTLGASFRSQQNMRVKAGSASLSYANEVAHQILSSKLDVLDQANFKAEMPTPWVLGLGASWKPAPAWTLAFDARLTGWKAYKSLDVEFLSEQLTPYNQYITKDYRNAWAFSLGAQWAVTRRLDLRAGVMVDTTPVNKAHYNPETPGMTKVEPTVGLSFRPVPSLSVDAAFMYVAGTGMKSATGDYDDLLSKSLGQPYQKTFTADYGTHAFIPALGLSYSF